MIRISTNFFEIYCKNVYKWGIIEDREKTFKDKTINTEHILHGVKK